MDIFRIKQQFKIKNRGIVCIFDNLVRELEIGEKLYDIASNEFVVSGFEMIRRNAEPTFADEIGYFFKSENNRDLLGTLLLSEKSSINMLFSSDPITPSQVDIDYKDEWSEAKKYFQCALFSLENFEEGKKYLFGDSVEGVVIYRGWMLSVEQYADIFNGLKEKGIHLINTPEEYQKYHHLPEWYKQFEKETPKSIWTQGKQLKSLLSQTNQINGSCIVKDYVKSRKHEWHDACFIKDIKDIDNLVTVINNFVERQANNLTGGIVLREFENLNSIGFHDISGMPISEEYRVFIFKKHILVMDNYWSKNANQILSESEIEWIQSLIERIESNFVTIDLARKENGTLIVMELGDGQVSGLQEIDPKYFYQRINLLVTHSN